MRTIGVLRSELKTSGGTIRISKTKRAEISKATSKTTNKQINKSNVDLDYKQIRKLLKGVNQYGLLDNLDMMARKVAICWREGLFYIPLKAAFIDGFMVELGDISTFEINIRKSNIKWCIHAQVPDITIKAFNVLRRGKRTMAWITLSSETA